jgi:sulfatase maturation enzyme AslB (radical SAM superfamily)
MEKHNKVSGRQRQLIKVGIRPDRFEASLASSPFKPLFDYSNVNQGKTTSYVQDWQVDLGNYCNSQCIMCSPKFSSRLASEFKSIGLIAETPPKAWCDDPILLERFCEDLLSAPSIRYIHFIGGETLITPGFKRILTTLVDSGRAKDIIVGFTTNLTVWDDSIVDLLLKFNGVNLGLSIETLTTVNDYIRYPSKLATTKELLDRWVELGRQHNWLTQLRITPTCLTIEYLDTVLEYAYSNNVAIESCNFLTNPKFLRISVLPMSYRKAIANKLLSWASDKGSTTDQIINTRAPQHWRTQIVQDTYSYVDYLLSAEDESHRLPDLVEYLKKLEANRKNSILTYLPNYEELLRSAGY